MGKRADTTPPVVFRRRRFVRRARGDGRSILSSEGWERVRVELGLSPRELQLVQHIFDGKKLSVIARDMRLALGTIKTYSQRIHSKLEVSDQRELTLAVIDAHLQVARVQIS